MHRRILAITVATLASGPTSGQGGTVSADGPVPAAPTPVTETGYRDRLTAKLHEAWLQAAAWHTDYDAARAAAARSKRKLLVYFTRSYAPQPDCEAIERGLFRTGEFLAWSRAHELFAHVAARLPGRKNDQLFKEMGGSAYPAAAFATPWGELIAFHTGAIDLATLRALERRADGYLETRRKAADGDHQAQQELLVADLGLRRFGFALGSLRLAAMRDMPGDLRAAAEQHLIDIQSDELFRALTQEIKHMPLAEFRRRWEELSMDFFRAGRIPSGPRGTSVIFGAMSRARRSTDPELFGRGLEEYKRRFATDPVYARRIELYEHQLEDLRAQATAHRGRGD